MTIDDVLKWIATQDVERYPKCSNSEKPGAYKILNELRFHILMKTNPHNREDIKRVNIKDNIKEFVERENEMKFEWKGIECSLVRCDGYFNLIINGEIVNRVFTELQEIYEYLDEIGSANES